MCPSLCEASSPGRVGNQTWPFPFLGASCTARRRHAHVHSFQRPFSLRQHCCPPALSAPREQIPCLSTPGPPALLPLLCPNLSKQSLLGKDRGLGTVLLSLFLTRFFSHLILSITCALIDSEMSLSGKVTIPQRLAYSMALMLGHQVKSSVSTWPTQLWMPSAPLSTRPLSCPVRGSAVHALSGIVNNF